MHRAETERLFPLSISSLPGLHEDETLYSWLARTHQLNGRPNALLFSQQLFANRYAAFAHDFPSHLEYFHSQTDALLGKPTGLASHHSLMGYYQPWFSDERHELAMQSVLFGSVSDLKMKLGLPASKLGQHPLKACPDCIRQELDDLGYSTWHTDHQFPSVWVCSTHGTLLWCANNERVPRHLRQWLLPHRVKNKNQYNVDAPAHATLTRLARLSRRSADQPSLSFKADELSNTYRSVLHDKGLIAGSNTIRMNQLVEWVVETYRPLMSIPGFNLVSQLSGDWAGFVGSTTRKRTKPAHPVKHLMIINLLFADWEEFISAYGKAGFSIDTTPKIEHRPEPPDARQDLFIDLVRNQNLSLSSAGRHVGISPTTAVRWAKLHRLNYTRRTKYVTETILERCRQKLRAGRSKQTVAKAAGVSMTTITRLLSAEPSLRSEWHEAIQCNRRRQFRSEFRALVASNPGVPLKLIRKLPNNRYAWLYKHDREWLSSTLAALVNSRSRRPPRRAESNKGTNQSTSKGLRRR